MIFPELVKLYENLVKQGKISPPGWMDEKASYGIELDDDGSIKRLINLKDENDRPCRMPVPQHPTRTSKIFAFFLWDNGKYLLGIEEDVKFEEIGKRFNASKKLHLDLLKNVDSLTAAAIKNFFLKWEPDKAVENELIKPELENILKGANLILYYDNKPATEDKQIRKAWEKHIAEQNKGREGICLVTGRKEPIARLHPLIKGVRGAQSTGAALVSFNENAFCSYELESGDNAQMGTKSALAYAAALNYLLADPKKVFTVGDITLLGWTEKDESVYSDMLMDYLNQKEHMMDEGIQKALKNISKGQDISWEGQTIDLNHTFYVLGISPNAARLSVRFFFENSFGSWLENIRTHNERMEIVLPAYVTKPYLPFWMMADELRAPGGNDKMSPLTSELLQAILRNSRYPDELLTCTIRRLRADKDMNWKRAAILKAYLIKNGRNQKNKEGCSVGLNTETDNQAYLLGRLFSILEHIQDASSGGTLNTTIKSQYLNSMCSTPGLTMARLLKLKEKHMKKLKRDNPGLAVVLERQASEIMGRLEINIKPQLNMEEQAVFMLGYYHQTQKRYEKKKEEE